MPNDQEQKEYDLRLRIKELDLTMKALSLRMANTRLRLSADQDAYQVALKEKDSLERTLLQQPTAKPPRKTVAEALLKSLLALPEEEQLELLVANGLLTEDEAEILRPALSTLARK